MWTSFLIFCLTSIAGLLSHVWHSITMQVWLNPVAFHELHWKWWIPFGSFAIFSSGIVKTLKIILNFMKDNRKIQTLATIELSRPFLSSTVSQTSFLHLVDLMCIEVWNSIGVWRRVKVGSHIPYFFAKNEHIVQSKRLPILHPMYP